MVPDPEPPAHAPEQGDRVPFHTTMNNIPTGLKKQLLSDPEYTRCALLGYHTCGGRITLEHALIFAGRQVQERFAIIPVCAAGQEVDQYQDAHTMDKNRNRWVALNRASEEELRSISKAIDYRRERDRLNAIYGPYIPPAIPTPRSVSSGSSGDSRRAMV